jgi:uncharacterized membrane protein (UPF0136 family)
MFESLGGIMARIRKAVVAGLGAGVAAGAAVLFKAGALDDTTIGQALGAFAAAAVAVGWATWRAPNAGTASSS